MNDYTEELGFWLRLESFIKDVQPKCCMGEEEKDMILHNCKLKILNITKWALPERKFSVCRHCKSDDIYFDMDAGTWVCNECNEKAN